MEAQALILAAGAGTRMKSAKPKVLHELLGKPLVRWAVDAARAAGCSTVHAVHRHSGQRVGPTAGRTAPTAVPPKRSRFPETGRPPHR